MIASTVHLSGPFRQAPARGRSGLPALGQLQIESGGSLAPRGLLGAQRGERVKKASAPAGVALPAPSEDLATEFSARARAAWARLIGKVYETPSKRAGCGSELASLWRSE